MYCKKCGTQIDEAAIMCPACGTPTDNYQEPKREKPKAKTWPLVFGIISIVLFLFIMLQSCAAGVANTLEANGEGSGTIGFLVATMYLSGGIVLIATRRKDNRIASFVLYLIAALLGIGGVAGSFTDLKIWGGVAFALAVVCLVSTIRNRKQTDNQPMKSKEGKRKTHVFLIAVVVLLAIAALLLILLVGSMSDGTAASSDAVSTNAMTDNETASNKPAPTDSIMFDSIAAEDEPEQEDPQVGDDNTINVEIAGCHVEYVGGEIVENLSGEICAALYYDFTNNSDENKSFAYTVGETAFQNGIELEASFYHVNEASEYSNLEIQPGTTVTVCSAFVLRDDSPVEIQVGEWISFTGEVLDSMVLTIE